jgi:rubrerythrin
MSKRLERSSRSWSAVISSRSIISDKLQDLLALEVMAHELYEEALRYPESRKYAEILTLIMNDEMAHINLVKKILDRI